MVIESERAKSEILAHAVRDIDMAVADLMILMMQSQSVSEALKLRQEIEHGILKLQAVESACLHKADALCGQ